MDPHPQQPIPPDLAQKVLAAETRNAIQDVSDGGKLPAAQRKMIQHIAITPGLAAQQRIASLLSKWSAGIELTSAQVGEVRAVYPDFLSDPAGPGPDSAPAPPGPALALTPDPSPAHGDGGLKTAQLAAWAELYGTQPRQLRRWIARGLEKKDPCPLDNPFLMPAWIDKHLEKIRADLRERVSLAAAAAAAKAPPPASQSPPADPTAAAPPASGSATAAPPGPDFEPIDLTKVGGVEGQQVEFFRTLFATTKAQLEKAYLEGPEVKIPALQKRLESLGESLIKHEKAAEAKARRGGDMITKAQYAADWAQAIDLFKQMREHRVKAVLAALSEMSQEQKAKVAEALQSIALREEMVFTRLGTFKSTDDLLLELAA